MEATYQLALDEALQRALKESHCEEDACWPGSLSYEAKEAFLAALVSEGRAEWVDKSHKKCLILWLRIQDWANYILDFVKENGLEVTTIEDIRSGIETHGTELAGIDRGVLMRALRLLEQKGKAVIFKGTSADDEGVKFSV
ncbi:Vacuolar protein sorting-associated protein 25 [Hordeum vulgare]|nr:Vacuolar protein sorting-associated protein 25 [Hordeum vulgare]